MSKIKRSFSTWYKRRPARSWATLRCLKVSETVYWSYRRSTFELIIGELYHITIEPECIFAPLYWRMEKRSRRKKNTVQALTIFATFKHASINIDTRHFGANTPASIITSQDWNYKNELIVIPAWISNGMLSKVWNDITYPCNGATAQVWERTSKFISYIMMEVSIYPCWDSSQCMLAKGVLVTSFWRYSISQRMFNYNIYVELLRAFKLL